MSNSGKTKGYKASVQSFIMDQEKCLLISHLFILSVNTLRVHFVFSGFLTNVFLLIDQTSKRMRPWKQQAR